MLQLVKPMHPVACVPQQEKPPQGKAHALQLEKAPCVAMKTQLSQNKKIKIFFKSSRRDTAKEIMPLGTK